MNARDTALLNDLLDGRLDPTELREVRSRLEAEPALREAYDELRHIGDVLRREAVPGAPTDFLATVRDRIDDGEPLAAAPHLRLWTWLAPAVAAAAAVLLAFLLVNTGPTPPTVVEQARLDALDTTSPATAPGAPQELDKARDVVDRKRSSLGRMGGRRGAPPPTGPGLTSAPRRAKSRVKTKKDEEAADAATDTYRLEAPTYREGHARLAVAMARLGRAQGRGVWGGPGILLDGLGCGDSEDPGGRVLGSVLLSLTPTQYQALREDAGQPEASACAPVPVKPQEGARKAEDELQELAEDTEGERIRVRILIVEPLEKD